MVIATRRSTYSLGNGGVHQKTRVEGDVAPHANRFNDLTAGNIGVHRVVKHGRNEGWHAFDHRCWVCAVEDVVSQERLDSHGVVGLDGRAS